MKKDDFLANWKSLNEFIILIFDLVAQVYQYLRKLEQKSSIKLHAMNSHIIEK
mgnify:CR=1 FL=1